MDKMFQSKDIGRQNEFFKKRSIYILPAMDSFQTERHLQIESGGKEEYLSGKLMEKER